MNTILTEKFLALVETMRRLRKECPWDQKQTHQSLKKYILEEAYEVIETIDQEDWDDLSEELGDLLLQIIFQSIIAEESGTFSLVSVINKLNKKLIERHPHVFGQEKIRSVKDVENNWEHIKLKNKYRKSLLDGIPEFTPALIRAQWLQEKAAKVSFDWVHLPDEINKVQEELNELKAALKENNREHMDEEIGDLFFSMVNVSRFLEIPAESSLHKSNEKFAERFKYIEEAFDNNYEQMRKVGLKELDKKWDEAKKRDLKRMPSILPTFLDYVISISDIKSNHSFINMMIDFFKVKYPDLEFGIIQHIYAPECYKIYFAEKNEQKYIDSLKKENYTRDSEFDEFLKSGDLLVFPLTNSMNQVKFLMVIHSCPENLIYELSQIVRQIKDLYRFVSAQIEKKSGLLDVNTANLVSQISHDFNSLLALIPKKISEDEVLDARIQYSEVLSREIMFYLRELSINKSAVPVKNLFHDITSGISIPGNVKFNLEFTDNFDSVTVDVELIDRAISSIIMNASFAASIDGGEIKMKVGKRKNLSPFIKFDWLEIIITDTGPGISKEFLEEVKNPLFTTWKEQGHAGLGLSIADKIIQAHDGYLDINSSPEKGTMVSINLPLN